MVEGDAKVPLQNCAEHTFIRTVEAQKLGDQLLEMREKNGGTLDIIYYVSIGPDGSTGHHFFKTITEGQTEGSELLGKALISSFISLQLVTEYQGKTTVIHSNALAAASDSVRPLRLTYILTGREMKCF